MYWHNIVPEVVDKIRSQLHAKGINSLHHFDQAFKVTIKRMPIIFIMERLKEKIFKSFWVK